MTRDTSFDAITDTLIQRYVVVLKPITGWGSATAGAAVYGELGLPMPQEPFPACYVYLAGQSHDYSQGALWRLDINTVMLRIIGGPITPGYKYDAERKVYTMVTAVVNELDYRPQLQDPTNADAAFQYLQSVMVGNIGRIQGFSYGDQGAFIGIEIPTTSILRLHMGRVS